MAEKPPPANEPFKIPVLEEELGLGVRTVDTGRGVRVRKTVTEHPVVIDERLQRDEVVVTRVAVDRVVAPDQAPAVRYEGETLVVPVLEEVLVVERKVRIKEELHITRSRREDHYHDTVVLKTEQVAIERFGEADETPPPT